MLIIMNNKNSFLNKLKIKELIEKNKLTKVEKYSFSYEEEFFPFLNIALSRTFTKEKKIIFLKLEEKDEDKKKWSTFKANISLFNSSQNLIIVITTDKIIDTLKDNYRIENIYLFDEFSNRELNKTVKSILKENKIEEEKNLVKRLITFNDMNMIENEIKKIKLIPKNSSFTYKDILFVPEKNKQFNFFHNFFFMKTSNFAYFLEETMKKETIYVQLDYFIKNLNKIILYYSWKNYFIKINKKSDFSANKLYKEFENILGYYSIKEIMKIHLFFVNLREIFLKNRTQDIEKLVIQKIILLSINVNKI